MRNVVAIAALILVAVWAGACAKMLGLEQERESNAFEHRAHVVEGINCLECHAGIQEAGDTGPMHFPSTADCVGCHEEPHDPNTCADCHGRGGRMDWQALGFAGDPAFRGDRRQMDLVEGEAPR